MKKVLIAIAVVVLVPVLGLAGALFMTMRGLEPLPNVEKDLGNGVHLINDGFAALYLLKFDGGVALVDCGDDATGAVVLAELKKRELGPGDVKAIFLTHGHPDHIASCHLFPNAEVYAFPGDVGIAGGTGRSKGPLPRWLETPPEKRIKVTKTLTDGETITLGDRTVTAFAVPGHTAGSASYLTSGALIMGDNAQVESTGKLRPAMWLFSDDAAQNEKSLLALTQRLHEQKAAVELTAYGHSGPSPGMKALEGYAP